MRLPRTPLSFRFLPGERITDAAILARLFWFACHAAGTRYVVGKA